MNDSGLSLMRLKVAELQPMTRRMRTVPERALFIYVAGLYSAPTPAGVQENVKQAALAGFEVMKKGHVPIVPHLMFGAGVYTFFEQEIPYKVILDACLDVLRRCDAILFLPKWQLSHGARIEYLTACATWRRLYFDLGDIPSVVDAADTNLV